MVILGAGPAGICAASALGAEALVLEQCGEVGGLTCSFDFHGVVFDRGGHSFHSPHPQIRELVYNAVEMYEQKREARCIVGGDLIHYPFQKHFHELKDPKIVEDCKRGLCTANGGADCTDLESYLYDRFGAGIAEHFLMPYNRKLWGSNLRQISTDWVSERIAGHGAGLERFETSGGIRRPLQGDTTVAYPARGGFGAIAEALARKTANLRLGVRVALVDPVARKLITTSGEVLSWSRLVSTLPLDKFLGIIADVPTVLRAAVTRLRIVSLKLLCIVIDQPVDNPIQRIYSADSLIAAHKMGIVNNSSDYFRSSPRTGIFGEVAYPAEMRLENTALEERFLENLLALGLIRNRKQVIATRIVDLRYAYPAPTLDRRAIVAGAKDWLADRGIYTIGRFGEWAYINSDEAMYRGFQLGQRLAAEI